MGAKSSLVLPNAPAYNALPFSHKGQNMTTKNPGVLTKLRCSKLPLYLACPASTQKPEVNFQRRSDPSTLGSAAHDMIKEIVADDMSHLPDVARYAAKWAVEHLYDDLVYLGWAAIKAWDYMKRFTENVVVERFQTKKINKFIQLTGTSDFRAISGELPVILDWKSGRERGIDYLDQLLGYLFMNVNMRRLSFMNDGEVVGKVVIAWLRFGDIEVRNVTKTMLLDFKARVIEAVRRDDFIPGNHCHFCARKTECPARSQLVETARNDLVALEDGDFRAPAAVLADLYPKAKVLQDTLDSYFETLREQLHSGSITSSDGTVLSFKEETRSTIDATKAMPLIERYLGENYLSDIQEIITLSKGKLMKIIGADEPRGEKTAVRKLFLEELDKLGGLRESTAYKITEERKLNG